MRINLYFFFGLLLVITTLTITNQHKCGIERAKKLRGDRKPSIFNDENHDDDKRNLQSFESIRITVDYTNVDNASSITADYKANSKKVIDNAVDLIRKMFKVNRLTSALKVGTCDIGKSFTIDNNLKTTGVNSDLLLFVVLDTEDDGTTEAWALSCANESRTGRPVIGATGIGVKAVKYDKENWLEYYTYLFMHEIFHVLGFNEDLYGEYYNPVTRSKIPLSDVLLNDEINGLKRKLIKTPKVLEAAKKHFNCNSLKGVELENQGGAGTVGSHWESRTMLGEVMMGISFDEVFLSEITCAFFEDMGWYQIDCFSGGLFKFGYGQGCDFVNSACMSNQKTKFEGNFCDKDRQSLCMTSDRSKGVCKIETQDGKELENLQTNPKYQYFGNSSTGGYFHSDFCPVSQGLSSNSYLFPGDCTIGRKGLLPSQMNEVIGEKSGCFNSSLALTTTNMTFTPLAICYEFECDFNTTTINITVSGKMIKCPGEGGNLKVEGFTGSIQCPKFNDYCRSNSRCNTLKDCVNKSVYARSSNLSIKTSENSNLLNTDNTAKTSTSTNTNDNNASTNTSNTEEEINGSSTNLKIYAKSLVILLLLLLVI